MNIGEIKTNRLSDAEKYIFNVMDDITTIDNGDNIHFIKNNHIIFDYSIKNKTLKCNFLRFKFKLNQILGCDEDSITDSYNVIKHIFNIQFGEKYELLHIYSK